MSQPDLLMMEAKEKEEPMMLYTHVEKVKGTSFYKQDLDKFDLDYTQDLPEATLEAVIIPEPTNAFDPYAKRIEIIDPVNPETRYHIGYVAKDEKLYNLTKPYKKRTIPCRVNVKAWSTKTKKGKPMNDSYSVLIDRDHSVEEESIWQLLNISAKEQHYANVFAR